MIKLKITILSQDKTMGKTIDRKIKHKNAYEWKNG
jgi:hypothetical protein